MFFADRLTLDKPRRSSEGYMGVHARSARSGVYQYLGREIDPDGKHFTADETVNVYRAPEEVFDARTLGSFVCKPITNDHPSVAVTSDNWRALARGTIMGAVQEGEYVGFDLAFLDAAIVETIDSGKRELSCGYESQIIFEDGLAPDGTPFRARQTAIRGNHVAVVDLGRAGSTCRIGDAAKCDPMPSDQVRERLLDERTYTDEPGGDNKSHQRREAVDNGVSQMATKTITFDGMPIEATDASEAAIRKLEGQLADSNTAKAAAETTVGELTATVATKDGEIAGLNAKLKDAEIGPAQLEKLVADRSAVIAKAKAIDPNVVTDGKSDAEIRAAVVAVKLGDAAPTDDNGIAGAFAALTADTKVDPLRQALASAPVHTISDAAVRDTVRSLQY